MDIYTNFNEIEKEISPYVRKFKKQLRNIKRLKNINILLTSSGSNEGNLSKIWKCIKYLLIFYAIIAIFFLECSIPFINKQSSKYKNDEELEDSNVNTLLEFLEYMLVIIFFTLLNSPYTICLFFIIYKKQLISGDLLYSKNSGDNLNLIYTIKAFSGMALPLAYCNLLLYKSVYDEEQIPILYNTVKFPVYKLDGFEIMDLIKLSLFCLFTLLSAFFNKIIFYKFNDLENINICEKHF